VVSASTALAATVVNPTAATAARVLRNLLMECDLLYRTPLTLSIR
jgi:hypothetical protein